MTLPRRILFINPDWRRFAGCNISLLSILEGLDRRRFEPVVATDPSGEFGQLLAQRGIELFDYRLNGWWYPTVAHFHRMLAGLRERVDALSRLIEKRQISLVHTNAEYAIEGALAAACGDIPHVWNIRQVFSAEMDILQHFPLSDIALAELLTAYCDRIVPIAHALLGTFPDNIPPGLFQVIPSGIAVTPPPDRRESRVSLRQRFRLTEDTPVVLAMGRISPEKDLITFIGTARALVSKSHHQSVHFIHFGPVTDASYFRTLQGALGDLRGRVVFAGVANSPLVCLRGADILLLTSIPNFEGLARVCLEALQMETPVIATRCQGPEEYLLHDETALLAAPGDCETLAHHVDTLLRDPELAKKLAANGSRLVLERYGENAVNRLWMDLYEELITKGRASRTGRLAIELCANVLTLVGQTGRDAHEMEQRLQRLERMTAPLAAPSKLVKKLWRSFARPEDSA